MKRYFIIFSLLLIIFNDPWIHAGSVPGGKDKKPKKGLQSSADQKPASNTSLLIDAKKCQITGNPDKAAVLYQECIKQYPNDPVAYYELSGIKAGNKEMTDAIKLSQKALDLDPANIWYMLFLAELYQLNGDNKDAISLYQKITEKEPGNIDNYYQLASLYIASSRFKEAILVYDQIDSKTGISEAISLQKEKLYLLMNDIPHAQAELEKLVNAYPEEPRYISMLAEFYISNKEPEKAFEMYNRIQKVDPDNPYIHLSLADFYRKSGDKEKAYEELKLGFANPNLDIDTKVSILLSFYTLNELYSELKDKAFVLAKILIDVHPKEAKSHSIYGDLLMQDKQVPLAREEFIRAVSLDSANYPLWEEVLRLDLQVENYTHLDTFSRRALELFPEQPVPFLFAGLAKFQLKNYEEAEKDLDSGTKLVVNNDELLSTFYMYLGDTWHALNNPEESDKAYEKSLAIKSENAYVLNNYAYYLSLRSKDLDKAEKMAKKAVTLEPDNSSFQDTYGWVLFKLGRFDEAEPWIKKALDDKTGVSAEVLEHYGDVMFRLGDMNKAEEYWMKAKAKGPGSENLDKKISEKRLYD
jgi:tetratricopeptide (TPR) repeat protein